MIINEWCQHCEGESEVEIDLEVLVNAKGFHACSVCGEQILACSICTQEMCEFEPVCFTLHCGCI